VLLCDVVSCDLNGKQYDLTDNGVHSLLSVDLKGTLMGNHVSESRVFHEVRKPHLDTVDPALL